MDDNPSPILKKSSGKYILGIIGGSVALHLSTRADVALKNELKKIPSIAKKEILIIRLASGGYKQPQQLAIVNYLLSLGEINSLVYMREEEKLARDVYGTLYQRWKSNIFNNISSSEQTHMDAILHLLQRYNLPDPVASNEVGVFTNTILQDLYNQLVIKGNSSLSNAFQVGATIEDLDIFDLTQAMILVDNQDISLV